MSAIKQALKAAKVALDDHDYVLAADEAQKALAVDKQSYSASVFLGLALEKQTQNEASELAYKAAIDLKPGDKLAWQGLVTLYEKQAGEKLEEYHETAIRLSEIFMEEDDRIRCQSVLDKYAVNARKYGSRSQLRRSLEIFLPTTRVYDYLDGRIPQPALTYAKIADILELEEKEKINSEIGQRRTRLGAKIDQVTAEVKRQVYENSLLESYYSEIIDWTHDDDVRRRYEENLLERAGELLAVLPATAKCHKREQVQKQAQGLVILKDPFLLAWNVVLEWEDVREIKDLDDGLLREFMSFFPDEGLSKILHGYLASDISPFQKITMNEDADQDDREDTLAGEDRLVLMTEGMEDSPRSILAHRIMSQYYLYLDEYESAVSLARAGLGRVLAESNLSGLGLQNSSDDLKTILATALVQYQAPRHQPEARALFDDLLHREPSNTAAFIGIGMIYEEQEAYEEAVSFLNLALERSSDPKIRAEAAWCKALNGDNQVGLSELEACLPDMESSDAKMKTLRSQTFYRTGMCMWAEDVSFASRKDRNGAYSRFLASLQVDMNFAPSYTSLGFYYADYAKDRKRARKCFQKAFELSASEFDAAERLARSFARSQEWDLVEVVAQRVIESGKAKPAPGSRKKGISWPFAALGIVQLNRQEYAKSIVSFQSALRISPNDYHCWVSLGESYHNSGRYIAATRAFDHAQQLGHSLGSGNLDSVWYSKYMLANVKRELGEHDEAIAQYQEVLALRPQEIGVTMALLQCFVEGAWRSLEIGFHGRALERAGKAIRVAHVIVQSRGDAFNVWKAVGEACSFFSLAQDHEPKLPLPEVCALLKSKGDLAALDIVVEVDGIGKDFFLSSIQENERIGSWLSASNAAILAHKRAIYACADNFHAKAVAWYNLGWTEYRAHTALTDNIKHAARGSGVRSIGYGKAAVQCFKRAIELEAGNAEFWNALGVVTTCFNPKVSQHSFIRSLYLNDKNAKVWANLAMLYLAQDDIELASEAFTRAQSTDPDYALAWLGQGLVASRSGDLVEARHLFTHAYEIAGSSNIMIKQQYAASSFDHLISSKLTGTAIDNLRPLLALHQLSSQTTTHLSFRHLESLFAERVNDGARAVSVLGPVCSGLEAEHQEAESSASLMRFAQVKGDSARILLLERDFEASAECAESALNVYDDNDFVSKTSRKPHFSSQMTAGLALYHQGLMTEAISMFNNALNASQGDPDIVCLLSQVLWAQGDEKERDGVREQLLDSIEKFPSHVGVTTLLGAIAVLDDDPDTLEAVLADLESLRTDDTLSTEEESHIAQLMTTIASLHPGEEEGKEAAEMTQAMTATMLAPSQPYGWGQLAKLSDDIYPADVAVLTAVKTASLGICLDAKDLCRAYTATSRLGDAQRSIMIAPYVKESWDAFD